MRRAPAGSGYDRRRTCGCVVFDPAGMETDAKLLAALNEGWQERLHTGAGDDPRRSPRGGCSGGDLRHDGGLR